MGIGFAQPLYVLPVDHRGTFVGEIARRHRGWMDIFESAGLAADSPSTKGGWR